MNIPIDLIKYALLTIILIVAGFKLFMFTQQMVKKFKNRTDDDIEKIKDYDDL